jgi:soluble lytic murein transglycosylase
MPEATTSSHRRVPGPRDGGRTAMRRRSPVRRRRITAGLVGAAVAILAVVLVMPLFHQAVQQIALPLRHEDIIRQQAAEKQLDPALVAAVIFAESHFVDDRTSTAGAQGLMQLTPATARYIAHLSGGTTFEIADLGTPRVNIAYGAYYLRYLLRHYDGDLTFAVAAYNAGEGNVDRWRDRARAAGEALTISAIPFAETRAYVRKVHDARVQYRSQYATELGL